MRADPAFENEMGPDPFKRRWISPQDLPLQKCLHLPPPLSPHHHHHTPILICESFSRTGFCSFQETAIPSFLDPHLVALYKLLIRPHVNSWANSLRLEKLLFLFENQPFKEESCSETVDGNREESLGLRRVNVHCNHLKSIYNSRKVKVTKN